MLVSFHRGGGLATASRAEQRRSGATGRFSRLYSNFDAAVCGARFCARDVARLVAAADFSSFAIGAVGAGPAIACTNSRHHIPGAQ